MCPMLCCVPCLGLNRHVSSLWTCVSGLNDSVVHHGGIMDSIQKNQDDIYGRMKNLNSSLNHVLKDLRSFSEHDMTGELDSTLFYFIIFSSIAQPHSDGSIQLSKEKQHKDKSSSFRFFFSFFSQQFFNFLLLDFTCKLLQPSVIMFTM